MTKYKMIFGFCLLGSLTVLSLAIGLGKVHQDTSFGLQIILGCLSTLSGGFAAWAFGQSKDSDG